MYSQDGNGLGHLRRSVNIAAEVLSQHPRCNVLILADSPALSILATRPGIDVIKLPTIVRSGDSHWRTATLSMSTRRVVRLRRQLMLQAFAEFRPDTVLVDHMPVGALGELKPLLDHATTRPRPPKLFLGLRDVLDRPTVIRRAWQELGAYDYLPAYDGVLIYGHRSVYDTCTAYRLLPHASAIVYCNYISQPPTAPAPPAPPAKPFVLGMGGGGADAFPLAMAFVEAISAVRTDHDVEAVLLTGPNMATEERELLVRHSTPHVRIESRYGDAAEWIRRASAIVTMAGYNSLCEVLTWQKKAVVVPRSGPSAEQRIRSELFSERSLIRRIRPESLDRRRLATALSQLLAGDDIPHLANIPPLNGAQRVASTLLEWTPAPARPLAVATVNGTRAPVPAIGAIAEASSL